MDQQLMDIAMTQNPTSLEVEKFWEKSLKSKTFFLHATQLDYFEIKVNHLSNTEP